MHDGGVHNDVPSASESKQPRSLLLLHEFRAVTAVTPHGGAVGAGSSGISGCENVVCESAVIAGLARARREAVLLLLERFALARRHDALRCGYACVMVMVVVVGKVRCDERRRMCERCGGRAVGAAAMHELRTRVTNAAVWHSLLQSTCE